MTTATGAPFIHTADCNALAMGCAAQNVRDQLRDDVHHAELQPMTALELLEFITDTAAGYQADGTMSCPTGKDGCAKLQLSTIETALRLERKSLAHAPNEGSRSIYAGRIAELIAARTAIRTLIGA